MKGGNKKEPLVLLREIFGYDEFKPLQSEIIEQVLSGCDTLAILPTGGGKSLCYQIPALIFEHLTLVISPLIALMKDQLEQLQALQIPAVLLNSSLDAAQYRENMEAVVRGRIKLLYLAPESLSSDRIISLLESVRLDLLVVDEAHCISEWGHDFRPEYRKLVEMRKGNPGAACLALTATATGRVRQDILQNLRMEQAGVFQAGFDRENLYIQVRQKNDPLSQVLDFLKQKEGQSGIIYCFSRKQTDDIAAFLTERGFPARPYHAGLSDEKRRQNQEDFIGDKARIIVATIAFGMGINKPNVRFVLHYDLPKSIENYYQEIGRAGRDGQSAHCLLMYNYGDAAKQLYFINQKEERERDIARAHLDAMVRFAEDTVSCRRIPLLAYFGETYELPACKRCDNCDARQTEFTDITIPARKFLSCILRTGERFGAHHVISVLRGARTEKILRLGHEKLSTWGIGGDWSEQQWKFLGRQLMNLGYLTLEPEYQTLRLTARARADLKTNTSIFGRLPEPERKSSKTTTAKNKSAVATEGNSAGPADADPELFERLRSLRRQLAAVADVPAYVIFPDKTLLEMARHKPLTLANMRDIHGVGEVKMAKYGKIFMEEILKDT